MPITELQHPLVQHKVSILRQNSTDSATFRNIVHELGGILAYEASHHLETREKTIQTPLETMEATVLAKREPVLVSIMRAGNALMEGILHMIPSARVGHIGIYRDENLEAKPYFYKMPTDMSERQAIVADPMLATGHSAVEAISQLKEKSQPKSITFVCLLAAPEGIQYVQDHHPDVRIITTAIDRCLNENSYIVPGLGDAGDRIYGTF